MDKINIEETKATPSVILDVDNRKFEIAGCSRPENVREFYMPVINWFESVLEKTDEVKAKLSGDGTVNFDFKLSYFNSASAKFILDILLYINQLHSSGIDIKINWYYEEGDEDMRDVGEELAEMVDFEFKYIMMRE
ncbi:MAG: nuclear pore complex subunit [Salinivirgaceae bacterium]|nr:MAG: nuclear pore complex subunit [Salinivirgaceae bacterium]